MLNEHLSLEHMAITSVKAMWSMVCIQFQCGLFINY